METRRGIDDKNTGGEVWRKYPGFVISGGFHAAVVVALLLNFEWAKKFPDVAESIPVEMLTMSQFDEVMNGEKTAKLMPKPERRVDKIADIEDHKPTPPLAEAKKDTPTPDAPDKPNGDPGQAEKAQVAVAPPPPAMPVAQPSAPQPVTPPPPPPEPIAKVEPPPPPPAPQKPEPTPPEQPTAAIAPPKPDAPTPPPKPDDVKPPPDAEALAPQPPPRPEVEPKKEVKQDVKPAPKPTPKPAPKLAKVKPARPHPPLIKEAKAVLEPPPVAPPAMPKPTLVDRVANMLSAMKPKIELPKVELPRIELPKFEPRPEPPSPAPAKQAEVPKPAEKARAGNEVREAKAHNDFSLARISALLDHDPPQRKASSGRQASQVASLGAPNAHADKMSPSMKAQLDGWLIDHYRGCWSYFGLGATRDYIPAVHVQMAQDGSLSARPSLMNPPSDPNLRSLADSAIRAVNRCNPLDMPERFKPFYDSWRDRVVRFDPKELS